MLKRGQELAWGQGLRIGRGQTPKRVDTNRVETVDKSCLFGVFWGSKGGLDSGTMGVIYCTQRHRTASILPAYGRSPFGADHIARGVLVRAGTWAPLLRPGAVIRAWTMHPIQGA